MKVVYAICNKRNKDSWVVVNEELNWEPAYGVESERTLFKSINEAKKYFDPSVELIVVV